MTKLARSLLVLCALVGATAGCTSRTLPLPPPSMIQVTAPNASGEVTVSGYALESASVGGVNDRTQAGSISSTAARCSACPFTLVLHAQPGDTLRIWQFFETEGAAEVQVPSH